MPCDCHCTSGPAQRFELLVTQYHSDYGAKTPQMRARAIQEALLGSGTLEAARVFVMGVNPSTPSENQKVRVELSSK